MDFAQSRSPFTFAPPSASMQLPPAPAVFAPSETLQYAPPNACSVSGADFDDEEYECEYELDDKAAEKERCSALEGQLIQEINARSWCEIDDPARTLTSALKRVRIIVAQIHDIREWMYALPDPSNPLAPALALPLCDLAAPDGVPASRASLFDALKPIAEALSAAEVAFAGIKDALPSAETCKLIRDRLRSHITNADLKRQ
jgi:hypothetical protein